MSESRYLDVIEELGLGLGNQVDSIQSLTGGVASDIVRVELGGRRFCLKCALEKLKVKEDWRAPLHRNKAEYAWLEVAAAVNPQGAVALLGRSEREPCFAMEYLEGDQVFLWKTELLKGQVDVESAGRVGKAIGAIHLASTRPGFKKEAFYNRDDFDQLRLDPYLRFTAGRHPEIAPVLDQLITRLLVSEQALVHGDVSPKNILFRGRDPVILDAECATMGDPGFDIAFCLNHLFLKSVLCEKARPKLLESVFHLWQSYRPFIQWENPDDLEQRICDLLPGLMLARVDGKSPVEYFNDVQAGWVREFALEQLRGQLKAGSEWNPAPNSLNQLARMLHEFVAHTHLL